MFKTISVIGGDLRQLTLAKMLIADGYDVTIYGFTKEIKTDELMQTEDISAALDSEIVILPVPVSFDNKYINMPYSDTKLTTDELVEKINPLSIVFGGRISKELSDKLSERGIKNRDYMTRDELAVKNAVPTAEGAIEIAMKETPITIHGSKCLVLGYGKVGKILSKFLDGLGAKTYVMARKYADLALIEGHNCYPLTFKETKRMLGEFDIIFNTVPALILAKDELKRVRADALIIDLASKPGGIEFESAKSLGIRVIWALSLPGKVAPVTAGIIIKDTITNMLAELEV
jgi:dipicolinate synthase subunit A